jgi:hypothetical protein
MKKLILASVAIVMLAGSPFALNAYAANDPTAPAASPMMEARAALLDAHLAGLKAGLKLTADQERNWAAFEGAVRDIARSRAERRHAMREAREQWKESGARPSPIERMRMASDRLAKGSADLKMLADATSPLYSSLDDGQKRIFGVLFHDLVHRERHGERSGEHRG